MADNTIRYPDFSPDTNFSNKFFVGYDDTDKKERRFSMNDLLTFLGYADYSQDQIQGWLDAGFSWLDIGVFLLQRENLKRSIAEPFIFSRVPSNELDTLIDYLKTPEGFSGTGIALCDGSPFVDGSGSSWNIQDRFVRAYNKGISHDGVDIVPYSTQEDAMQEILGNLDGIVQFEDLNTLVTAGGAFKEVRKQQVGNLRDEMTGDSIRWYEFDNSLVVRTSSENRPKSIYFPYFQVVKKLDQSLLNYKQPTALNP